MLGVLRRCVCPTGALVCPQELHRVLRPGCSVAILDFNNAADNPVVDATQVGGECLRCAVMC